jgi:hypothetical protein
VVCPPYKTCTNKTCTIRPTSQWKVVLNRAVVNNDGTNWDPDAYFNYVDPDPYFKVTCGGVTQTTGNDSNTYDVDLDDVVFSAARAQDLMSSVQIEMWDSDSLPGDGSDDYMDQCTWIFSQADLEAGTRTIQNCCHYIESITFSFSPK